MYILCLKTSAEPEELLKEAYKALGIKAIEAAINIFERPLEREWNGPDCNGMSISASDRVVARLNYQENFDLDLDKSLYFFIDRGEERLVQDTQSVKVVLCLLEKYEGDMLFEDTQDALLIRKAGILTIDTGPNPWHDECLTLVKLHYHIAKLGLT